MPVSLSERVDNMERGMPAEKRHQHRNARSFPPVRFRVAPGIEITWCGTQMVLVHRTDGRRYRLNGLATRIWALLANGASRRTIVARLRKEVGAPAERLEGETAHVVERLLTAGLIERRAA